MSSGKSFGISYEYYKKTYIPNSELVCAELLKDLPPVGTYEVVK